MSDTRVAAVLFAVAALVLLFNVAPDVGWFDSGEITASLWSIGVAHPTGFPLYHPPGKSFTLLPLGHVAWRANLLSAVLAALTVAFLFLATLRAGPPRASDPCGAARLAAALGALGVLLPYSFWLHSVTVEVYLPTASALAIYLWGLVPLLTVPARELARAARRRLPFLAFGFGLGCGAHITFPLVAGALSLPALVRLIARRSSRRVLSRALPGLLLLTLLGGLVILYLPLAAGRAPLRNWGDPSTLARLFEHLSGARIRQMFATEMSAWDATALLAHGRQYAGQVATQLGLMSLPALVGLLSLARERRALLAAVVLALLADAFFTVKLNPMGIEEFQTSLPTFLILAFVSSIGLVEFVERLRERVRSRPGAAIGGLVAVTALLWLDPVARQPERWVLGRSQAAAKFVRQAMDRAPPGSLLVTSSDNLCAITMHLQGVENHRPDLRLLIKQQLWDPVYLPHISSPAQGAVVPESVVRKQRAHVRAGRHLTFAAQRHLLEAIVRDSLEQGRAVFFEPGDSVLDAPFLDNLEPHLPLWRLHPRPVDLPVPGSADWAVEDELELWLASLGGRSSRAASLEDGQAVLALAHWLRIAASLYLRAGRSEEGAGLLLRASRLAPREPRIINNLAVLSARAGDNETAARLAATAVAVSPGYRHGWMSLGGFRAALGERGASYRAYGRAVALGASESDLQRMARELGRMHAIRAEPGLARLWLDIALALNPGDEEAARLRLELGRADSVSP